MLFNRTGFSLLLAGVLSWGATADPLNSSLDLGTSTSQSYEARNVFIHPAGLGFDTSLHGAELLTSFAFASNPNQQNDLAFATTFGYLGFGIERLAPSGLSRYQFALGTPIFGGLFLGTRLGLYRYDLGSAMDSWDFGLQYRASRVLSFGLMLNQANTPILSGVVQPMQTVLSGSLRPIRQLELTLDASTPSNAFLSTVSSQAMLGWVPTAGVKFRAGYHTDYKWLIGIQIHLGNTSVFSSVQPSSTARSAVVGFQSGMTPYSSSIAIPHTTKMTIGPNLSDEKSAGGLLSAARPSLLDLLKDLETLEKDRGATSLVLRIEEFPLGLASAHEVHQAILRLRKAGVDTEVYLGNAGLKEYLIAAAADRVFMEPDGEIRWLGLRAEHYFVKGTLDKMGVEGEFLAAGKYKSAPEMFLRKESSEAAKTATLEELQSLEASLISILKSSRKIDSDRWKKLMEIGLLSSEEAQKEGLVDGTASFTSVLAKRDKQEWITPVIRYRKDTLALPPRVAVVVASGNIMPSRLRILSLGGTEQVTPSSMEKKFREVQGDERTRAVVLRVSSPGGEVLASQQIATRVTDLKEHRPVFVSMGDVAASGGYYISAPASRIFAGPLTITGSIGVFLGKFNFSGLFRFLDLRKEILALGPYPGLYSEDRPWTKTEKAVMQRRLNHYYDSFVLFVANNRHTSKEKTAESAQGRVWTGSQALSQNLVDESGGYYETIRAAAAKAGLSTGEYEAWEVESPTGFFDQLSDGTFARAAATSALEPWTKVLSAKMAQDLEWLSTLRDSPFLYLAPYRVLD